MLKLRKFNINIFLLVFEMRAKEPFTDNTVKTEETDRKTMKKLHVHKDFLKFSSC